jgi:hypothetical protein
MRLGARSKKVMLLENPKNREERVVWKQYDASDPHHKGRFDKEVAVLRRLRQCPFVPRLLFVDSVSCSMWISYCGPVATLNAATRLQVERNLREMAEKWGVHRVTDHQRRLDADSLFPQNICNDRGTIKCIDFGSACWHLAPLPKPKPKPTSIVQI